jgi:tRNA threonylcarbamoyl adenosine modification protein YeaZ
LLTLAFDTATSAATAALVRDGELLGERSTDTRRLLADVDALLREGGAEPRDLGGVAVGIGPGSFTGIRIGIAAARGLALALDVAVAGVSTLDVLALGGTPVIDAKRREVFVQGPLALPWQELEVESGVTYVGDGAVRYRAHIEEHGGLVPPDDDPVHVPHAAETARLARAFGEAALVEPLYVRVPDAELNAP